MLRNHNEIVGFIVKAAMETIQDPDELPDTLWNEIEAAVKQAVESTITVMEEQHAEADVIARDLASDPLAGMRGTSFRIKS